VDAGLGLFVGLDMHSDLRIAGAIDAVAAKYEPRPGVEVHQDEARLLHRSLLPLEPGE
jgi:hypothetical protein